MRLDTMSNALLALGVAMLGIFGVMQVAGVGADPLVPAAAAFLIGCTAVLDRLGARQVN
jgi:hypothetical protein